MTVGRVHQPEFDCIDGLVPAEAIDAAKNRARRIGVPAERALIFSGAIDEESYWRALAASAGIPFDPLLAKRRGDCPLPDELLIKAPEARLLPLLDNGRIVYAIAPQDARQFIAYITARPQVLPYLRLTSPRRLSAFVSEHARQAVGRYASDRLTELHPEMSAAPRPRRITGSALAAVVAALIAGLLAPGWMEATIEFSLVCVFLGWIVLRLFGMFLRLPPERRSKAISEAALPVYSIVVALYQEAASARRLVQALKALDYPGLMAQTPQAV
jgi:hypothetical protein